MYQEEQEKVVDPDADLPKYKVRQSDMPIQMLKLIVRKVTELIHEEKKKPQQMLQKNVCLNLVNHMRANKAQFGGGEGQWQCLIGKNMAATLNYDIHKLTFFDLPQFGYTVLVFKSG